MDITDIVKQPNGAEEDEEQVQQITFLVDTEEYGVDALQVKEIIRYLPSVKVPNAPEPILGVINFRGEVIPVVDLRRTFGLSPLQIDEFTVIVIAETEGKIFGMAVDRILDMVNVPLSKLNENSGTITKDDRKHLKTMVKINGRLILILDLNKLIAFDTDDLKSLENK
ncbi:MAG: chemotaxis protein CheW [Firmicutes bacterium]|nr:chemotaxis protein CheW [Bacillota bacterium]